MIYRYHYTKEMLEIRKLNKKKTNLSDALKYIQENTPDKIKNENVKDIRNESGTHTSRTYVVTDRKGIVNEFTLTTEDENLYLTHLFRNPNTELDLDDEEDIVL